MSYFVTKLQTYFRSNGDVASTTAKFWQFLTEDEAQKYANGLLEEHFDGFIGELQRKNPNVTVFGEGTKNCTIWFRMDFAGHEGHGKVFSTESYVVSDSVPLNLQFDIPIPWGKKAED